MKEDKIFGMISDNIKLLISVLSIIVGIVGSYFLLKQEIAVQYATFSIRLDNIEKQITIINTNHMTHLQNYAQEMTQLQKEMSDQNGRIERILGILEKQ